MKSENYITWLKIFLGKQKRLKQAKDEATDEIEKYRGEREKQFKEFESKVRNFPGSKGRTFKIPINF